MHWTERGKTVNSVDRITLQLRYQEEERQAKVFKFKLVIGGIFVTCVMLIAAFNL